MQRLIIDMLQMISAAISGLPKTVRWNTGLGE